MVAVWRSHMGLTSRFCSRSRSPWRKNSCITRSVQRRYNSSGFVGLLRSEQCTRLLSTCNNIIITTTEELIIEWSHYSQTVTWTLYKHAASHVSGNDSRKSVFLSICRYEASDDAALLMTAGRSMAAQLTPGTLYHPPLNNASQVGLQPASWNRRSEDVAWYQIVLLGNTDRIV